MNCVEARECVSALFDGEPISREAAAHLSDCDECRVRFTEYTEISADLRRMASAASAPAIPEGQWRSAELAAGTNWARNWKGTMRIPRFAFALMLVAIFALTGGLALVKARPEGLGSIEASGEFLKPESVAPTWFQYKMLGRDGEMIVGGIVPTNPRGNPSYDRESGMPYTDGAVYVHFRVLERIGEAEKIGVRSLWIPRGAHNQTSGPVVVVDGNEDPFEKLRNMPEREFFYVPGKDLEIPVEGYGNLAMRGHFESTLPDPLPMGLYPVDGHFRIDPPVVLVREKEMLGKFDDGRGEVSLDKSYFAYGTQPTGWYLFSAKPIAGAVEGTLKMNQIEFKLDGKHYLLLTGDPIVLGSVKVWVKHYDSIRDADPTSSGDGWPQNEPRLAFGQLANLAVEK